MLITTNTVIKGLALRYFRMKARLNNLQAADAICVSAKHYWNAEYGYQTLTDVQLEMLMRAFDVDYKVFAELMDTLYATLANSGVRTINLSDELWAERLAKCKDKVHGTYLKTLAFERSQFSIKCIQWVNEDVNSKNTSLSDTSKQAA